MDRISIIIPVRGEQFEPIPGQGSVLVRTVNDIYKKCWGDVEVIVVFDGPPYQEMPEYKTLTAIYEPSWQGTKVIFNKAARMATGRYLLKVDAHCIFGEGFDEVLKGNMEDNWVVMLRMYALKVDRWARREDKYRDYFKFPWPFDHPRGVLFRAGDGWEERTESRKPVLIDENMRNHGSFFFMSKRYFLESLGGFEMDKAGTWNGEDAQLTFKTWLGPWGGRVMVNKKSWFAHMHRGKEVPREFGFSHHEAYESARWTCKYWVTDQWKDRIHNFDWMIDRFWPIPGWPDNWQELLNMWRKEVS